MDIKRKEKKIREKKMVGERGKRRKREKGRVR